MDLFIGKLILGGYHSGATPFLRVFNECFATFSNLEMQHSPKIFFNFLQKVLAKNILLIDSWENQEAIDAHHTSPMMNTITKLREKYNLRMKVERYVSDKGIPDTDKQFIKE